MRKIILALDSSQMGGIETHILTLAGYLSQKGYELVVWFIREYPEHPLYQMLDEQKIDYQFCGSSIDFCRQLRLQRKHVILHTHGYKAGIIGRIFARLFGVPVLSTFHSGDMGVGKLKFYSYVDIFTAGLAERIAVSELIKDSLPKKKTHFIPNFVDVVEQPKKPKQKFKTNKTLQIAYVGRLSMEKGPDLFCRVTEQWSTEKPVEFVVYGDGPERQELAAEYHDKIDFKGHVNMKEHWCDVDALCISSRYEGLPYVALEAMALGIPVISFDVGGIGDLISDSSMGWLVEAGDVTKLTQALDSWYDMSIEQKAELGERVKDKINSEYSASALVPEIEAIYHRY
jgi:glycosyltransferase involved in cell wall biosynthesis